MFRALKADAPASELEFQSLWKLYALSLAGTAIVNNEINNKPATLVKDMLYTESLLDASYATPATRFRAVWEWVKRVAANVSWEPNAQIDPNSGQLTGLGMRLALSDPSLEMRKKGYRSLDEALELANEALSISNLKVWILFDRLDIAFAESPELEANGIRSLFQVYLDLVPLDAVKLKIFLRSDIWSAVTQDGFREASHITRDLTIEWDSDSLLNLVVRRMANVETIASYFGVDKSEVLANATQQRALFDSSVPKQIDSGKNPQTFEWILSRVQDSSRDPAPRELIHLLSEARNRQLQMLERGESDPPAKELLSRSAVKEALVPVSTVRLQQTLYAEHTAETPWIRALESEKAEHTPATLAEIWEIPEREATERARRLSEIGFMEIRGDRDNPRFWIPFLYRPALNLRQGMAEESS